MKRRVFRWCVRTAVLLGVIVAAALLFVVWVVGDLGESATERWVGQRLRAMTNQRLNARLDFTSLDYQYPDTIVFEGLRLSAEGPFGRRVDIVSCERATLALAERPRKDRALRVREATLERPTIVLIRHPDAGLIGFTDLVQRDGAAVETRSDQPAKTFGELFAFERVEVVNGRVVYDPYTGGPKLELDGITAASDLNRTDADALRVTATLQREGTLTIEAGGELRTDTGELRDATLAATLDLSTDAARTLPPDVQRLLETYEVRGRLSVEATGTVTFRDPANSTTDAAVRLTDGGFTWGGLLYPVPELTAELSTADGTLLLDRVDADAMQGVVAARGTVGLTAPHPAKGSVSLDGLRLEAREQSEGSDAALPLMTGAVTGRVTWDGPLGETSVGTGAGNLRITDAALARLTVVSALLDVLSVVPGTATGPRDSAEAVFRLENGRCVVEAAFLAVDAAGIKATGSLGFDGTLDLVARAGPLERIQQRLGKLGDALSATLSFLPRYRVTGTIQKPSVRLAAPTAKPKDE